MITMPWQSEELESVAERYELSVERLKCMLEEDGVRETFQDYFRKTAEFLLDISRVYGMISSGTWDNLLQEEMQRINEELYADILPEAYADSFGNPEYAKNKLGETYGPVLSLLYTEMRESIPAAFEDRVQYLTIYNELFIEIYNCFEGQALPEYEELRQILYWYASDYFDVFGANRMMEQMDADYSFAAAHIAKADLSDDRYLYRFGEYVTENELQMARHIRNLPEETVQRMADVYTEGFRIGFVKGNKDISKKKIVTIHYVLGFEKVVQKAMDNFAAMGLRATIIRATGSVVTKRNHNRNGYHGAIPNKQFDYDHRADMALILDKRYIERKLDVIKTVYEQNKELAASVAGPAVLSCFGEEPFAPKNNPAAVTYTQKQEQMLLSYDRKASQMGNHYMKGEERSFTIVAYPIPEIGPDFAEIFDEIIRINTLDADLYEKVQQTMIDTLDQGEYAHITGKGANRTDLKVKLYPIQNPEKETGFENCTADVNIPVGEVFTSPMLKGTNGVLHVSKVFLHELLYKDLEITFEDGKIVSYSCKNFDTEEENKKYIKENILHNQETLPLGEFAIGTNTTAYVVAEKYNIADKLPILIAEKMGPHFAVGDTCYSWSEDVKVYNSDGKEIVARDNEISIMRKESVEKAYFQCHTDITIPYEELDEINVLTAGGNTIPLIADGRFVLPGTEILNEPFDR